jgi:hypothetical protein
MSDLQLTPETVHKIRSVVTVKILSAMAIIEEILSTHPCTGAETCWVTHFVDLLWVFEGNVEVIQNLSIIFLTIT